MAWEKYLKIVVDYTKVDSDLTDFPLTVVLSASAGSGNADVTSIFDELGANKYKIKFEDASNNQKNVEIETWDDSAEVAVLHAAVDLSSTVDTVFRLYYDSTQADNTTYIGVTGESAAQSVWDSDFIGVWHMAQDPSTGGACVLDSTSYSNDLTTRGTMTTADLVDGGIGKAIDFDGTNDDAYLSTIGSELVGMNALTVESHAKFGTITAYDKLLDFASTGATNTNRHYRLYVSGSGNKITFTPVNASNAVLAYCTSATAANTTAYQYWAGTYDGTSNADAVKIFLDGAEDNSTGANGDLINNSTTSCELTIADDSRDSLDYRFDGRIAEVRISKIDRSAAWVKAVAAALTDGLLSYSAFKVSGTVKEGAANIARTVRAYNRSTGALLGSTTSSAGDGTFEISGLATNHEAQIVALDDAAGTDYNDLIYYAIPAEA